MNHNAHRSSRNFPVSPRQHEGFCPFRSGAKTTAGENRFVIHDGDLDAIAITFAATAVTLVVAMLVCDVCLGAIAMRGVRSFQDVPDYRLALDLLPWSLTFTALVTGVGLSGMAALCRLRSDAARGGLQYRTL